MRRRNRRRIRLIAYGTRRLCVTSWHRVVVIKRASGRELSEASVLEKLAILLTLTNPWLHHAPAPPVHLDVRDYACVIALEQMASMSGCQSQLGASPP